MRKLWLLAAAASLLLVARAPQVQAQDASVVTTCGTLTLPTGYAVAPLTQDTTGTLCTSTGGGGGGGAVTVADGADVGEGATTATAATAGGTGSVNSKLRLVTTQLGTINTTLGTPYQAGGALPLPTLAATSTKQSDGSQKTQIVDGSGNVIASTSNNLNVQCANCSGSGASAADGASFTAGASTFAPSGVFFQTTATSNPLTTGQQGMIQGTAQRAAFVNLRNASGTEIGTSTTPVQVSLANTAANATAVKVDGSAVTQPVSISGNQAVNVAQINGVTTTMGNGVSGTGVQRVTIASDSTGQVALAAGSALVGKVGIDQTTPGTTNGVQDASTSATGSAVPSKASYGGANSSGNLTGLIQADSSVAINVSTATTTQLVALSSGKKIYVTALDVIAGGTGNITFEYGTGSNCGTGTTVLTGAYNLTAQTGIAKGSGLAPVLVVPASNALCVLTSAAVQMSGSVAYTQF